MGCDDVGFGSGDVGVACGDVGFSYEDVGVGNLVGHGGWEVAWGWDALNLGLGQPGVKNSAMGRAEDGTMHGRAGELGEWDSGPSCGECG